MFLKKDKTFSGKNILRFVKQSNGSIAIIVLIIGIAVVLAVGSLSAYMIKDIKFTQLDEHKLKALNIAEAGIADMYSNLDLFYNGDINAVKTPLKPLLAGKQPAEGVIYEYDGELKDGTEVLGTYYVEYKIEGSTCTINSKGVDTKSQTARKVAVKINIVQQSIYDYIYSGKEVSITGSGDIDVNGNFFINDNFKATGSGEENFENIIVRGDLTITGSNNTINGPIFIGGNLKVEGNGAIDSDYENPLIVVMGDISKTGIGNIGTPERKFEIYCGGEISIVGSGNIYYFLSEDEYIFDYPDFNVKEYIAEFSDEINNQGSKYVISSSLTLDENLINSAPSHVYYKGNANNWIRFYKDVNGNFILEIEGNIVVEDDIVIGENTEEYTIYYKGEGKLFSTDDITVYSKLIPITDGSNIPPSSQDIEDVFPEKSLLFLIADNNIDLDIQGADDGNSECSNPDVCIIGVASNQIYLKEKGITVKGTLIAGEIKFHTGSGDKGKICYDEDITEYLPTDLPDSSFGSSSTTFTQVQWQELTP